MKWPQLEHTSAQVEQEGDPYEWCVPLVWVIETRCGEPIRAEAHFMCWIFDVFSVCDVEDDTAYFCFTVEQVDKAGWTIHGVFRSDEDLEADQGYRTLEQAMEAVERYYEKHMQGMNDIVAGWDMGVDE